jgi:hypothetical protein
MHAVRPGFIEYLDQGAGLPSEEDRELVRAALSFIFDHQLVYLGDTYFDRSHNLVGAHAVTGSYFGARHLLRNSAETPTPLGNDVRPHILCEKRTSDLLQLFIQHSLRYRLDRITQKIWDAKTSTLDSRIARLVATIEKLRDIHLGEGESLLPKKDWAKLCAAMKTTLTTMAKEIGANEQAVQHLANKLPNINFASSTKQFDRFFESLGLPISKDEQEAMDVRNHQAHGIIYEREHYKELISSARTVQVLLNRIVLALIEYQGTYNDHTQFPSVEVPLSVPSGATDFSPQTED